MVFRPVLVVAFVALAVSLSARSVEAHGGLPMAWEPLFADGQLVGAGGSWGIVTFDRIGRPRWVCEEATGEVTRAYSFSEGRFIVATREGIMASTDFGCSWQPLDTAIGGRTIAGWYRDPSDFDTILASTDDRNRENAVFASYDGGGSWERISPWWPHGIRSVRGFARSADLLVVAEDEELDEWRIMTMRGGEWETLAGPFGSYVDVAVHSDPGELPLATAQLPGEWAILGWTDEGEVFERIRVPRTVLDLRYVDRNDPESGIQVATADGAVGLLKDGVLEFEDERSTCFLRTPSGPWRCHTADDPAMFEREAADGTLEPVIPFLQVLPRECTTDFEHRCFGFWPISAAWFEGDPDPELTPDVPNEQVRACVCTATGGGGSSALAMAFILLLLHQTRRGSR